LGRRDIFGRRVISTSCPWVSEVDMITKMLTVKQQELQKEIKKNITREMADSNLSKDGE